MKSVNVSLSSGNAIEYVNRFVDIISRFDCDMDLTSGRCIIDAKSVIGIFSLDLSRPIELVIHCSDEAIISDILEALAGYIVG